MHLATSTLKGLAHQYQTDPDAWLLMTGAALSTARVQPLRGVGRAMFVWGLLRQTDRYAVLYQRMTDIQTRAHLQAAHRLAHATNPSAVPE